jgi:hypothetical protein
VTLKTKEPGLVYRRSRVVAVYIIKAIKYHPESIILANVNGVLGRESQSNSVTYFSHLIGSQFSEWRPHSASNAQ